MTIEYVDKLKLFENLLLFIKTPHLNRILTLQHGIIFLDSGNQGGKTSNIAFEYVLRILGLHPIPDKNRLSKSIRCLSSSLPESKDAEEQDNTQYLELKKLLPYEAIVKDITARSSTMTVLGHQGKHYVEFRSTKQEVQDLGKVQRCSLWCDEEPGKAHWAESRMRLHARGGDTKLTLTPINGLSWTYDDIFMRASYFWRSDAIVKATGLAKEEWKKTGSSNIAVIQMATDDNPTLNKESIDRIFEDIDDPDELNVRRYGVFKQIAGRVHKAYNPLVHYISFDKYFPDGIPYEWTHARGIDYHESRIPWSIGWLSISPDDEWFLWQEFHPAIDGPRAMSTYDIAKHMARNSKDYYYVCNLIDPLANKKQANTLLSVTDDLNRHFDQIRKDEGIGTQAYWEGWDTKDTKGRDEIRKRFKNAAIAGKPFNNVARKHGVTTKLPTLWICDTCPNFHKSIQRWSYGEWQTAQSKQVNDPQSKPQNRWSHDPMVLECLGKDARLLFAGKNDWMIPQRRKYSVTGRPLMQ